MVKGITRQVIVVQGPDQKLFDQAIFLVREEALAHGGVTEEALLQEARSVCRHSSTYGRWRDRLLWGGCGAAVMGAFWILSLLF